MKKEFFTKLSRYVRRQDYSDYGNYVQHTLFTYNRVERSFTTYVTIKNNYDLNYDLYGKTHICEDEKYSRLKVTIYISQGIISDIEIEPLF